MSYKIFLSPKSDSFLRKLDDFNRERIKKKLRDLSINPELGKPLVGRLAGLWSLRIEDYRAIYEIKKNELIIYIFKIGHRKNIYEI